MSTLFSPVLPCPFCQAIPPFPSEEGTSYDLECNCGKANVCIQISDLMTNEERSGASFKNYRYPQQFIDRAKEHAIQEWNTRAGLKLAGTINYKAADGLKGSRVVWFESTNSFPDHSLIYIGTPVALQTAAPLSQGLSPEAKLSIALELLEQTDPSFFRLYQHRVGELPSD